jgi:hypothetical protein
MVREIGKKMRRGEPLHAALKRDFEAGKTAFGISAESVGSDFDLGPDAIYKVCNEGAGRLPREMKTLVAWHYATGGYEALRWVAEECECLVIPKPTGDAQHAKLADLCQEFADVVRKQGEVEADGVVTTEEAEALDREIEELIAAACAYREEQRARQKRNGRAVTLKGASI